MLPTFIEDEDEFEKVDCNDQTHSGGLPSNMAKEENVIKDPNNNEANE